MGLISRVSSRTYRSREKIKSCLSPPRDRKFPSTTKQAKPPARSTPQPFSKPQSEVTSLTLSTPTSERMLDKLPESKRSLVNKPPLNPGVPVELLLVFLESEGAEPTDPAKPLSVPCVVSNACQEYKKTKQAVDLLKTMGAWDDVKRVYATRRSRAGRGKSRDRKHVQKLGPAIIYAQDNGIVRAFRNIP